MPEFAIPMQDLLRPLTRPVELLSARLHTTLTKIRMKGGTPNDRTSCRIAFNHAGTASLTKRHRLAGSVSARSRARQAGRAFLTRIKAWVPSALKGAWRVDLV